MDLNRAMIIGRLVADPEVRTTPNGVTVASFRVATSFVWTNQEGQKQEKVEYHRIVAWRKLGEICGQYLRKGRRVYIEGRIETRSWEDPSGIKRYFTEITADNMIMLDSPFQKKEGLSEETVVPLPEEEETVAPEEQIEEQTPEETEKASKDPF